MWITIYEEENNRLDRNSFRMTFFLDTSRTSTLNGASEFSSGETRRERARNSRRSSPIVQAFVTPKKQPICYLIRDFEKCWWRLAGRQFARPDESPCLSPHPCVLIQRNRFSLTHAMDTLIPSSRPPIPINFTDRRNIPGTRWETHDSRRHTAKDAENRGTISVPSPFLNFPTLLLRCRSLGPRFDPNSFE